MMSGEFDYADIFFPHAPFPGVTYIIFIMFFLFISIIMINLLVGLTVDDVTILLITAGLKKRSMRVSQLCIQWYKESFTPY